MTISVPQLERGFINFVTVNRPPVKAVTYDDGYTVYWEYEVGFQYRDGFVEYVPKKLLAVAPDGTAYSIRHAGVEPDSWLHAAPETVNVPYDDVVINVQLHQGESWHVYEFARVLEQLIAGARARKARTANE